MVWWETMGTTVIGGVLFKAWAAILVKSTSAVRAFAISELVAVEDVTKGLANFAFAPSREVALTAFLVGLMLIVTLILICFQSMLVTELPIVSETVSVGFVRCLVLDAFEAEAAAVRAVVNNQRHQLVDLLWSRGQGTSCFVFALTVKRFQVADQNCVLEFVVVLEPVT